MRVQVTTEFAVTFISPVITIDVVAKSNIDYYQEYIVLWKQEKIDADTAKSTIDGSLTSTITDRDTKKTARNTFAASAGGNL